MAKCKNCTNLYNLSDENDVATGKRCPKINDSPDIDMERECEHFKRMTQANRIRSMTDEELAEFIIKNCDNPISEKNEDMCDYCKKYEDEAAECDKEGCKKAIVKWLQSEVEEA